MSEKTRIVKLRSGQYAVQRFFGPLSEWKIAKRFEKLSEANEWRDENYPDEVVEIVE